MRFSRDTHTDLLDFLVESVRGRPDGSVPIRLTGEVESLLLVVFSWLLAEAVVFSWFQF